MLVSPKIGVAMLPRSPAWLSFSSQERITWVQRKSPTIHNYPTSDVTGIGWNGSYRTIVSTILTKHCCHKTVGRKESEAWTPHLAPCSTWTKIWRFLSDLCLVSQNKIWRFLFGIYRKRGRNQTWSGLKWPPAARQFSLVFPTAWTWNPWRPVSSPATLPWIRTCAPMPPIRLGHWGGWVSSSKESLNPYLLDVQGARYPAAGLQFNLSTCDSNHLQATSSCWQSIAIQTVTIHVWPG